MSDVLIQPLVSPRLPPMAESYPAQETASLAKSLPPLIAAVAHKEREHKEQAHEEQAFVPQEPQLFEQLGVSEGLVEELILKTLYARGATVGRDLSGELGLKFSLIEPTGGKPETPAHDRGERFARLWRGFRCLRTIGGRPHSSPGMPRTQSIFGRRACSYLPIQHRRSRTAAEERLAHAEGAAASLSRHQRERRDSGSDRTGGEFRKVVPPLRAAGKWKDLPRRSFVQGRQLADLRALRDRVSGIHHQGVRSGLPSSDRERQRRRDIGERRRSTTAAGSVASGPASSRAESSASACSTWATTRPPKSTTRPFR